MPIGLSTTAALTGLDSSPWDLGGSDFVELPSARRCAKRLVFFGLELASTAGVAVVVGDIGDTGPVDGGDGVDKKPFLKPENILEASDVLPLTVAVVVSEEDLRPGTGAFSSGTFLAWMSSLISIAGMGKNDFGLSSGDVGGLGRELSKETLFFLIDRFNMDLLGGGSSAEGLRGVVEMGVSGGEKFGVYGDGDSVRMMGGDVERRGGVGAGMSSEESESESS